AFQGLDLVGALDLELAESEGMVHPRQVELDVEADAELFRIDQRIVVSHVRRKPARDVRQSDPAIAQRQAAARPLYFAAASPNTATRNMAHAAVGALPPPDQILRRAGA